MENKRNGYYSERGFEHSQKLKDYDFFNRPLPITYTEGCTRNLIREFSKDVLDPAPHFGKILIEPKYYGDFMDWYEGYRQCVMLNTLYNVYEDKESAEEYTEYSTPELAEEILGRMYPENYSWIVCKDGCGHLQLDIRGENKGLRSNHPVLEMYWGTDDAARKKATP